MVIAVKAWFKYLLPVLHLFYLARKMLPRSKEHTKNGLRRLWNCNKIPQRYTARVCTLCTGMSHFAVVYVCAPLCTGFALEITSSSVFSKSAFKDEMRKLQPDGWTTTTVFINAPKNGSACQAKFSLFNLTQTFPPSIVKRTMKNWRGRSKMRDFFSPID